MNNGFNMVKMGSLIESISMGPFGSDVKVEFRTRFGVPIIDGSNIMGYKVNEHNLQFVSEEKALSLKKAIVKAGDIVVTHRGTLGQIAYVPDDLIYKEHLISQSQFCFRLKKELANPVYIVYYFHSNEGKKRLLSFANYVGVPALALPTTNFRELEIHFPALEEQNKIANILSALDEKIALNNKINAELEETAKTLYDYWFTQFDFPDENGKPYKSSGGKMVYSETLHREIPENWEVKTVKELLNVVTGKEDANFSTPNGKYNFFTCSTEVLKCDKAVFNGRAVLIAGNGDFNVKHYTGKFNAYQRTYVLIPKDEKYYGVLYIASQRLIEKFKRGSNGSIVKFITKGDVENIQILIPNNDAYFNQINRIFDLIESNEQENQELAKLRDWLLPMLMNGQATVCDTQEEKVIKPDFKSYDERFNTWIKTQGYAARGDVDMDTLKKIFDAMDEDDKK